MLSGCGAGAGRSARASEPAVVAIAEVAEAVGILWVLSDSKGDLSK